MFAIDLQKGKLSSKLNTRTIIVKCHGYFPSENIGHDSTFKINLAVHQINIRMLYSLHIILPGKGIKIK